MAEPPNLPRARHEHKDVTFGFGLFYFGIVLLSAGVVIGASFGLFAYAIDEPVAAWPVPDYPAPTLQASPRAQMAHFLRNELRRLNSVGWIDRKKGIVHIPIAEAMLKVSREGIKGWPKPATEQVAK